MFQVKIDGRIVAHTALEDENASVGARYGAARLTPEYEAFRQIIRDYTQITCMRTRAAHPAEEKIRSAFRNLSIELLNDSQPVVTQGQIEITDIGNVCEGSTVVVTVRSIG